MPKYLNKIQGYFGGDKEHYTLNTAATEKGKSFRIEFSEETNKEKEQICCIKVDKGIIVDRLNKKCDFLFYHGRIEDYHFVEFKGQDISQAVAQIKATVVFVKAKLAEKSLKLPQKAIYGYIVSSSLPKEANQKYRKLKEDFIKETGVALEKANNVYIKTI